MEARVIVNCPTLSDVTAVINSSLLAMVLETVDRALIGVDVSFGSVRINPCSGWVKLEDHTCQSPC
eukprot:2375991-Amphidinium_carterae.1